MLIKNRAELIKLGLRAAEKKTRRDLLAILDFTLQGADPFFLTVKALSKIKFRKYRRIFVIGAGKGTYRMALAAEKFLGKRIKGGWINVPEKIKDGSLKKIRITLASHPFPNQGSLKGARRIISLVKKVGPKDLVLALFSGGASSLLSLPAGNLTLADKIKVNRLLLRCGAKINEINAVRKHLSRVKGGWLGKQAGQTNLLAFYLSDVVGNDLSTVASGPTAPDKSTFQNSVEVLKKYNLWQKIPRSVREYLEAGERGEARAPETPKKIPANLKNLIIGSHQTLVRAAFEKAKALGYRPKIITAQMAGVTEKVGRQIIEGLTHCPAKAILIAAGETAFKVRCKNPGGRNQQMGLAVLPKIKPGQYFLAFDSDGIDGVSNGEVPVGGVLIDFSTLQKTKKLKNDLAKISRTNDSYRFFQKVGGQIKTGYVGTNLGDIVLALKA